MVGSLRVEVLAADALGRAERARWAVFRAANPALASPYFDLRYTLAAAAVAPQGAVAVIRRGESIVGFLPFQRRGALVQPLGAPLTDYHGLIAPAGADIDLKAVLELLQGRRLRFSGLVGAQAALGRVSVRPAMAADVSQGFEAWADGRKAAGHGDFLRDKARRARKLSRDHGPLNFRFGAEDDGVLDLIFHWKRRQMRRTAQHDVFASKWTCALMRALVSESQADFGLRFAVLRAGSRVVAAEVSLRSGPMLHLWFPVYDPDFSVYSPGALMTIETLRAAAAVGIANVDFGPAGEDYKRQFADPGQPVFEGDVTTGGAVEALRGALAGAPAVDRALSVVAARLDRRWDRIAACEPHLGGRVGAASRGLGDLGARHPRTSIGVGLGLGLSAALLTLATD